MRLLLFTEAIREEIGAAKYVFAQMCRQEQDQTQGQYLSRV